MEREVRDAEERRRLDIAVATAEDEARRWEAVARDVDAIGNRARPLLAHVVTDWTPAVLDGAAATRGWHALLHHRDMLQRAVGHLDDDAAEARRRANQARADAAAARAQLARLAALG